MRKKSCSYYHLTSTLVAHRLKEAGALPNAPMPPKPKPPEDRVDIREPRYALAALETLYRKCHERPNHYPVTEVDVWHFAKFPEVWATQAIRQKASGWNFKRCEPVVSRVRQLYIWAAPILEN